MPLTARYRFIKNASWIVESIRGLFLVMQQRFVMGGHSGLGRKLRKCIFYLFFFLLQVLKYDHIKTVSCLMLAFFLKLSMLGKNQQTTS